MSASPQAHLLPDGRRLHLNHGPIDLIIGVDGPERADCFRTATTRFQSILTGLVSELPSLRNPTTRDMQFKDPVAKRMCDATRPYSDCFVTPMAAVAGAVADEVLDAMLRDHAPAKAYVNNGGDIAFHLAGRETITIASAAGPIRATASDNARGIATSGWQGRSHSLGIADAVTVLAKSAARSDIAATLIANSIDLPGHPQITRVPAQTLSPDSDLGSRLVTTHVGRLSKEDAIEALERGVAFGKRLCDRGLITEAALTLQGRSTFVSARETLTTGDLAFA